MFVAAGVASLVLAAFSLALPHTPPRPAQYGAYHGIEVVTPRPGPMDTYEIVGPVRESSDVVGSDRRLPPLQIGDLLAIRDAGAYGSAMASNYNRRPLPAEVVVDEGRWDLARRRQTVDDMLALETSGVRGA